MPRTIWVILSIATAGLLSYGAARGGGCAAVGMVAVAAFVGFTLLTWDRGPDAVGRERRAKGLCERCAYNLTGNVSGVCPECGARGETR